MSTKKRSHSWVRFLQSFPSLVNRFLWKRSCYVTGAITSQSFPDFLSLSESCQRKAVFVQRHNTSFHSKFRQTALKLTPKGLDYTQIDTLREPCITDLWFWEVLGQSQSWLRTMQMDLWKLYVNSRIFEFESGAALRFITISWLIITCDISGNILHVSSKQCW